jgi:hypothetical protein
MSRPAAIKFSGICTPPTATVSGGGTINVGGSATIRASLTGTGPWTLTWSDGQTQTTSATPASRVVSPTTNTQYTVTAVTDATGCAGSGSGSATVTVTSISPPATASATTSQSNTLIVTVQWAAAAGASWYQVERATSIDAQDWTTVITHVAALSTTDRFTASPSVTTYLYRVRSGVTVNNSDVLSAPSPLDYATVATALFSDDPLVAGATRIRDVHITELRRAIDAMRSAAHLQAAAWSPYGPRVNSAENREARGYLDEAVQALVGHNVSYTGETPAAKGLIHAYQMQQIRDGVR